ncbi:porin [Mesorhizobium humile]|uniref:Porin n=1 Tax=Mesorhizobium humile TaxID=3072313 RepID=A0ABU4YM13_9HYPH|nr:MULTISPECIES: porin [unclassified Mesorhizobium]MDX8457889.1 porin [Mesorhizobium sp. VK2D]MDX8487969.1 porin [Mesorhizobium sp. VK2B]
MKIFAFLASTCASVVTSQIPSYAETSVTPARFGYAAEDMNPAAPTTNKIEFAKICTEFGEGYFYIPGTDTCLRISGEVRADYRSYQPAPLNYSTTKPKAGRNSEQDAYDFRAEGRIKFDARTRTEYGLLRSFLQVNARVGRNSESEIGSTFVIDKAFLQLDGWTAGFAHTYFGIYDLDYAHSIFGPYYSSQSTVNLLAYTADFGRGFSATISIEDGGEHRTTVDPAIEIGGESLGYGGKRIPDLVDIVRLQQDWGQVAAFGALHEIRYAAPGYDTDRKWAAGASATIKIPSINGEFVAEGTYADGVMNYLGLSTPDASYVSASDAFATNKGWSLTGEVGAQLTPAIKAYLIGSFVNVDMAAGKDFSRLAVTGDVRYAMGKGCEIIGELGYLNQTLASSDSEDAWIGGVRLRRTY